MMNAVYMNGDRLGLPLFFGIHAVAMFVALLGIALLLLWAFKHLSEKDLWKWGWILVGIGLVLCLLTIPELATSNFRTQWNGGNMRYGMPMMRGAWNVSQNDETTSADQAKEEADGKALYDALQSKQKTCADLSDSDFELIGEYVMGTHAGNNHEQMNTMIKGMMGDQGEEQVHITIGRNQTGCTDTSGRSSPPYGMMNGLMMRTQSSASSR